MKAPDGTPMANAMLSALNGLGMEMKSFGDSNGEFSLASPPGAKSALPAPGTNG